MASLDLSQSLSARRAVLCLSGGMDSTSLLLHLLDANVQIHGLSFHYGQRHAVELQRLESNLDYLRGQGHPVDWQLIDLRTLQPLLHSALTDSGREMPLGHYAAENMRETVVPNRNAIFASIAYAWALSLANRTGERVAIGLAVHSGDHAIYPDCRPAFYDALLQAFALGNWESEQVTAYLPYLNWDKAQILADGLRSAARLQLDCQLIYRQTCTSYLPDEAGRSHGLTGSDVERILAFDQLGLEDPLEFQRPWKELVAEARRLMLEQEDFGRSGVVG
ncbi:MAG: 7-cyano-7-deazaguanine synthase [Blastopirellula sp.]|nr:7-cyano-7-deazaguanine synthase [Blastopirellula sp.]